MLKRIEWFATLSIIGAIASFVDAMAWAVTAMDLLGRVFAVLIVSTVVTVIGWAMS